MRRFENEAPVSYYDPFLKRNRKISRDDVGNKLWPPIAAREDEDEEEEFDVIGDPGVFSF